MHDIEHRGRDNNHTELLKGFARHFLNFNQLERVFTQLKAQ